MAAEALVPLQPLPQASRNLFRVEVRGSVLTLEGLESLTGRDIVPIPHEIIAEKGRESEFVDVALRGLETALCRFPMGFLKLIKVLDRNLHKDKVADQIRLAEGYTRRVQTLKDVERVLALKLR